MQEEPKQRDDRDLPTGINSLTLDKVKTLMASENSGITAEELGEKMGASRTTARRYVEYLVTTGNAGQSLHTESLADLNGNIILLNKRSHKR